MGSVQVWNRIEVFLIVWPWQVIKYLSFVIRKMGGSSSFYEIPTVSRYLNLFRAEEMELAYTRIAELMKRDPSIEVLSVKAGC